MTAALKSCFYFLSLRFSFSVTATLPPTSLFCSIVIFCPYSCHVSALFTLCFASGSVLVLFLFLILISHSCSVSCLFSFWFCSVHALFLLWVLVLVMFCPWFCFYFRFCSVLLSVLPKSAVLNSSAEQCMWIRLLCLATRTLISR